MFSEHGISEVLCSDNGPQYVSAQFAKFCTSWGITQDTSSPNYPQSNRFAEACVKSVKHALQHAKYSSADLQLAFLALQATPINAKLPSPAELLYQCQLRTTIPAKSTTPTQQPSKFANGLIPTLMPSRHRQISTANLLHPCMLVRKLPCMMPFARFGSLLWWYVSYPRTATRYAPAMVLFTITQDDTSMNEVSSPLTPSQRPQ